MSIYLGETLYSGGGSSGGGEATLPVISYASPSSIPIKSGMQIIFYVANGDTVTVKIGNASTTVTLADGNVCTWWLWVQTAEQSGSLISPSGNRVYMDVGGTATEMIFTRTSTKNMPVITIG